MLNIFDQIADKISKGVSTVGVGSKTMMGKVKINTIINNLENEKKELVQQLGTTIYDMYKATREIHIDKNIESCIFEIDKRINLIAQQQAEIKRLEEELELVTSGAGAAIKSDMTCTCGYVNPEGVKFCAKCGTLQQTQTESQAINSVQEEITCICGHVKPKKAKFCPKCGTKHDDIVTEAANYAEEKEEK